MVDLNEMRLFSQVVKEQSFTRAARALGLPKSTVSERIARLEARLGVRLLQRSTRSVGPTEVGLVYYEHCARIVAEAEEADARVRDASATPRGLVRVASPQLFGQAFLGSVVVEFLERYPETEVELVLTERKVDLVEEGFDLAILIMEKAEASLVVRKLGEAAMVCCASARYVQAHGAPSHPRELPQHACLTFSTSRLGHTWHFERGEEVQQVRLRSRYAVNSIALVRQAALQGLGIALLPHFLCAQDIRAGLLVPLLAPWSIGRAEMRAVYPSRRYLSAAVKALLDLLTERLGQQAPWRAGPEGAGRE